jgi:hypothetical protein
MANDMSPVGVQPDFEITRFFVGRTHAQGLFEDRRGRVRRRFIATLDGTWEGSDFVLREDFVYDDGETERRAWYIRPGADGRFTATCDDCVGSAVGQCDSASWWMRYDFRLKMKRRSVVVSFDDRVYRIDQGLALNRATVRKWGFRLGEVLIVFRK